MKFSIIIPVYNAEKYINNCIQTLTKQTLQDFEVVLINDGSKDATGEICDKFAELYPDKIKVLHQENKGQLLTRWNGIKNATGEYCVFLDVDDELVENGLELLHNAIEKYDNPDMVIYSFFYDDLSGVLRKANYLFGSEVIVEGETEKQKLYEKFFSTTLLNNVWTKAVRRCVLEKDDFDYMKYQKLRCSEDRLHSMGMVTNAERIVYIQEPIYIYKLMPNSISRTFDVNTIDRFNVSILYEEEVKYIQTWNLPCNEYKYRLGASFILQTWYVFDMYYNQMHENRLKQQILNYNWKAFVPKEVNDCYLENPYLSVKQKKCWGWILDNKKRQLRTYFCKKRIYKKMKNAKNSILGKNI